MVDGAASTQPAGANAPPPVPVTPSPAVAAAAPTGPKGEDGWHSQKHQGGKGGAAGGVGVGGATAAASVEGQVGVGVVMSAVSWWVGGCGCCHECCGVWCGLGVLYVLGGFVYGCLVCGCDCGGISLRKKFVTCLSRIFVACEGDKSRWLYMFCYLFFSGDFFSRRESNHWFHCR